MSHKNLNFGKNIAQMRASQKISQDELAKRASMSRSMLSKIERDEVSPTIAIANKIALGLNTSVSALLDEAPTEKIQQRKLSERIVQIDPKSGIQRQLLMHTADIGLGIQHLMSPAGATTGPLPKHRPGSRKYILIEQGSLRVILDHTSLYCLDAGDCFGFSADVEHEFQNAAATDCCCLVIVYEPPYNPKVNLV